MKTTKTNMLLVSLDLSLKTSGNARNKYLVVPARDISGHLADNSLHDHVISNLLAYM